MLTIKTSVGDVTVSSTNSNRRQRSAVRVYLDGTLIGEVFPKKHFPLRYIREHDGQYRRALLEQLSPHFYEFDDFMDVVDGILGERCRKDGIM